MSFVVDITSIILPVTIIAERKESVTVGGVFDPDKGALIFREEVEETVITPEEGSEFQTKKITRVTSETRRLGMAQKPPPKATARQPLLEKGAKSWSDETSQVEANPLYSSNDYVTDFSNPLYSNRQSAAEAAAIATSEQVEMDDMAPLVSGGKGSKGKRRPGSDYQPEEEVDVLF